MRQEQILWNGEVNGKNILYDENENIVKKDKYYINGIRNWISNECRRQLEEESLEDYLEDIVKKWSKKFKEINKKSNINKKYLNEKIYSGKNIEKYLNGKIKIEQYYFDGEGYTKRYSEEGILYAEEIYLKEGFSGVIYYNQFGCVADYGLIKNGIKYEGTFLEQIEDKGLIFKESYTFGFGRVRIYNGGTEVGYGKIINGKKESEWEYTINEDSFIKEYKEGKEILPNEI